MTSPNTQVLHPDIASRPQNDDPAPKRRARHEGRDCHLWRSFTRRRSRALPESSFVARRRRAIVLSTMAEVSSFATIATGNAQCARRAFGLCVAPLHARNYKDELAVETVASRILSGKGLRRPSASSLLTPTSCCVFLSFSVLGHPLRTLLTSEGNFDTLSDAPPPPLVVLPHAFFHRPNY